MTPQEINTMSAALRRITHTHETSRIIPGTSKLLGNCRLRQRLSDSIVIPGNENHFHVFRDLPDKLRGQPILFVDIGNFQIDFLPRIHSDPVYQITADENVLDAIGNVALVRSADLALQPAQDPAKSILHEHLTPNMNIRY